ncbi:MAG TPA: DUF2284 domain-containing protein, partial [Bacillota bacterium]|nr:DUF2284 domain-containing protein [Bacillota bacterium]
GAKRVVLASGSEIPADMVILGIGVKPEVWLAREAGLAIGPAGGIRVDEYMRTSDPFIYAVGDAVQVRDFVTGGDTLVPLAGPANRQGRLVADNIAGTPVRYKGIQGTAIIKIIKLAAAVTGGNEKSLRKTGVKFLTCHLHPQSHAAYYPGGSQMSLKLLFTPDEGRVLGAQAVGYEGVDKCIDVIATAMRAGMTVFDLQDLELAYAPPFSSAKHPVNMAGYAAANVIQKYVETVDWNRAGEMVSEGALLIDVRTPKEVSSGAVEGSVNIPLDDLRNRLDEIPGEREVLAYCQVGLRSYIANRILRQRGFKVKNVSGGFNTYKFLERTGEKMNSLKGCQTPFPDTGELIKYAGELGVTEAREIRVADIIVKDEVVSAGCANCPEYGRNLMCPPSVPPPSFFKKTLSTYKRGIIMRLDASLRSDPSVAGYGEAYAYGARLHLAVYSVEKRCRQLGFTRSAGYIAGCCRLCGVCPGLGERCRDPEKARSSMEANGIDVLETCSRIGWKLEFPVKEKVSWIGLILLD